MKNLGKILLLIFLFPLALYGGIRASVDSANIELGDTVTLSLTISGDEIERPNLHTICDSDIISSSSQTSIVMVNGDYHKDYILSYQFLPEKSCEIKAIELEIDGIKESSNSIKVTVSAVKSTKDAEFELVLKTDKKNIFVGESFDVTLLLKQKKDATAVDNKFVSPSMKGFWVKAESKPVRYEEDNNIITKVNYTLAPQRVGQLNITKAQLKIASRSHGRDSWGSFIPNIKWKTYFSNELSIDVKPLPNGVELIGDFSIKASVDKYEIGSNEAVNLNIEVNGIGNLEDIKSFKPHVDGVAVFDEKIVIDRERLTQKLAFIAEDNFVIPPFSIKYFDTKIKEIKTITTKEIKIGVKNTKPKEKLVIKKEQNRLALDDKIESTTKAEVSYIFLSISLVIGFIIGVLVMMIKPWNLLKNDKKTTPSLKEPKILLIKLLPFKDDKEVQDIVDMLEKNIYSSQSVEIDKRRVKAVVEKYEIT